MKHLPQRLLRQRLALGAALCVSLTHCADLDSAKESEGTLPGDTSSAEGDSSSSSSTPSVVTAPGFVKVPSGVDARAIKHWFIELEGVPLAQAGDPAKLDEAVETFRESAYKATLAYQERYRFDGLVHGISVQMSGLELGKLGSVKGIKAVYPVGLAHLPKLQPGIRPAMANAVVLTGADIVHDQLGWDGTGIKVGIIDSGIDIDHPDFREGGVASGELRIDLTKSYDFVGDHYDPNEDEEGESATPVPDAIPDDCGGHGTHVAGIIGASGDVAHGGVRGVAPGVTFQSYRVFGCNGAVTDDVIAAAIERAFADGADIINLSLGSDNGWATDFSSLALSRAVDLGIVPVAAAGNNGSNGPWTMGSPGGGENTVTVASVDNSVDRANALKFSDDRIVGYQAAGDSVVPTTGTIGPVVYVGRGCLTPEEDPYLADPNGKVALITRGVCAFAEKYARAVAAGATAVIFEQPESRANEALITADLGPGEHSVIAFMISYNDGQRLQQLITLDATAPGSSTITFTDGVTEVVSPTGGLISGFSSWGPTPELLLKPDIAAPGGSIRSTWPLSREDGESAGYAVLNGTSMATPHVAGAIALLLQSKPSLTPQRVLHLLQNNAEPVIFDTRAPDYLSPVHQQGAGLLRIDRAVQAKTIVSPSKVFAGEGEAGTVQVALYLENLSNASATYTFGVRDTALATEGDPFYPPGNFFNPDGPAMYVAPGTVEFLKIVGGDVEPTDSVTVAAGAVITVGLRITAPGLDEAPEGTVYGGYVTLTPQEGATATAVSIPYAGIVGDYQAINPVSFPIEGLAEPLVMINNAELLQDPTHVYEMADVADAGHVFSMKEGDVPAGIMKLSHAVQKWSVELVPHGQLSWLGAIPAFTLSQLRRDNLNDREGAYYTSFQAADLGAGRMPDGVYHVRMTLLKALGTPAAPGHEVMLESTTFRIDRSAEPPAPPEPPPPPPP